MVDVENRTIRDAEMDEVKEKRYGEEVLDYLEDQWRRTKVGKFARSDWRCLSSKDLSTPQQEDKLDCEVLLLGTAEMFVGNEQWADNSLEILQLREKLHIG